MRGCPYCAEQVQDAAIKCKHCGEMIGPSQPERINPYSADPVGSSAGGRRVGASRLQFVDRPVGVPWHRILLEASRATVAPQAWPWYAWVLAIAAAALGVVSLSQDGPRSIGAATACAMLMVCPLLAVQTTSFGGKSQNASFTAKWLLGLWTGGACLVGFLSARADAEQRQIASEADAQQRSKQVEETNRRQSAAKAEFDHGRTAACAALTVDDVERARAGFDRCVRIQDFSGSRRVAEQGLLICAALNGDAAGAMEQLVANWTVAEMSAFQESGRTPAETPELSAKQAAVLGPPLKEAVARRVAYVERQRAEYEAAREKESRSHAASALETIPWEVKLAALDGHSFDGTRLTDDQGRLASNRIRYLMAELERKTGTPPNRIADSTVAGRDALRKRYGKDLSLQEILESVNASIPERSTGMVKYEEAAATFVVLYGR